MYWAIQEQAIINQAGANDQLIHLAGTNQDAAQTIKKAVLEKMIPYMRFLLDDKRLEKVKEKLGYKLGVFDREARESVEGTRIQVMAEIDEWALKDTDGHPILLITGLPGSGKSTLADMWTNSRQEEKKFIFGARICFTRQREITIKAVICSIAIQLLERTCFIQALEAVYSKVSESEVQTWTISQYIENIFTPLVNIIIKQLQSKTLVIVIDALDECSDIEVFKALQTITSNQLPNNLKLLLTSRADDNTQRYFKVEKLKSSVQSIDLNQNERVEEDIIIYMNKKIQQMEDTFERINNKLNNQEIQSLAKATGGLFICAKTMLG